MNVWWIENEEAIALLRTPSLVSMRRVTHAKFPVFAALATNPQPLPIELIETGAEECPTTADPVLADAAGLPALRVLRMSLWQQAAPAWLLDGALGKRLQRIETEEQSVKKWRAAVKARGLPIEVAVAPDD